MVSLPKCCKVLRYIHSFSSKWKLVRCENVDFFFFFSVIKRYNTISYQISILFYRNGIGKSIPLGTIIPSAAIYVKHTANWHRCVRHIGKSYLLPLDGMVNSNRNKILLQKPNTFICYWIWFAGPLLGYVHCTKSQNYTFFILFIFLSITHGICDHIYSTQNICEWTANERKKKKITFENMFHFGALTVWCW